MPIQFQCSQCQKTLKTPDGSAGKRCRCPDCGQVMVVPNDGSPSAQPPASSPPASSNWQSEAAKPVGPPPSNYGSPSNYGTPSNHGTPSSYGAPQSGPNQPQGQYFAPPGQAAPPTQYGSNYGGHQSHGRQSQYPSDRSGLVLSMGIVSLVVGMISCGCCGLAVPIGLGAGIAAWIIGHRDLNGMRTGHVNPTTKGALSGGMVCGIIGTVINSIALLGNVGFIILQVMAAM